MVKRKKTKPIWWLIAIPAVVIIVLAFYSISNNTTPQSNVSQSGYIVYEDPTYAFRIEYPQVWEIRKDTQVFQNGDAIAFRKKGPTQKEQTELTDGAQFVVSKPFTINTDLSLWTKEQFGNSAKFSQNSIGILSFEVVDQCSNMNCMTYFFTLANDKVYGIATFAQGPDKDKMVYENSIIYMLKSLKFVSVDSAAVSEEEAVTRVKALPEVINHLKRVPNGLVLINGEEDNAYMIQVYEFKNGHTATFNWYKVNKTTGKVEKQF